MAGRSRAGAAGLSLTFAATGREGRRAMNETTAGQRTRGDTHRAGRPRGLTGPGKPQTGVAKANRHQATAFALQPTWERPKPRWALPPALRPHQLSRPAIHLRLRLAGRGAAASARRAITAAIPPRRGPPAPQQHYLTHCRPAAAAPCLAAQHRQHGRKKKLDIRGGRWTGLLDNCGKSMAFSTHLAKIKNFSLQVKTFFF